MIMADQTPTHSKQYPEDRSLDTTLRPQKWDDYIGQETIKRNLSILIRAAEARKEPIEHLLFYGPAGLGKTTLAYLIAKELGAQIKSTSGPALERVGDIASVLTNLSSGDILFIDEAHRLNKLIEEVLYPAMENRSLDIVIGKGPSARIIQLELQPFTLIAATTRIALLSSPLRSRFSGGIFRLEFYTQPEVERILQRSASLLRVTLEAQAAAEIAKRSRFTPRIANRLLKRCRDYAQVHTRSPVITQEIADKTLELLQIDRQGLEQQDRALLDIIIKKFSGGPVGLQTIAAATSEDESTVEEVHEPYLIRLGFLERTPRGRCATARAYEHLGLQKPGQSPLLS
ncbi:MAG: Holliday junction branch migration DNA helicase RuvB [Parcubacteria group bacterium]|nr:Holliday junction branch migration DNA helicase RuvB [Parcubacteria group bacterium]